MAINIYSYKYIYLPACSAKVFSDHFIWKQNQTVIDLYEYSMHCLFAAQKRLN